MIFFQHLTFFRSVAQTHIYKPYIASLLHNYNGTLPIIPIITDLMTNVDENWSWHIIPAYGWQGLRLMLLWATQPKRVQSIQTAEVHLSMHAFVCSFADMGWRPADLLVENNHICPLILKWRKLGTVVNPPTRPSYQNDSKSASVAHPGSPSRTQTNV